MILTQENFRVRSVKGRAYIYLPSVTLQGYQRESGIFVAPNPNASQESNAAVIGTVAYTDPTLGLKEGDKVAVNYMVTSTGQWNTDEESYERAVEDHSKEIAKIGKALQNGTLTGIEASAQIARLGEVDKDQFLYFKHELAWVFGDELVWEAKRDMIIAVQRDGVWHPMDGYVLMERVELTNSLTERAKAIGLEVPDSHKAATALGQAKLISGECGAAIGSTILFDQRFADTYQFENGEEYLVISSIYVDGTLALQSDN